MDVHLVSWPGITLEVSPNFYAIFWVFLILSLILLVFSVVMSGCVTVVLMVVTVRNWNFLTTLILTPQHLAGLNKNRPTTRDQVEMSSDEIINDADRSSVTNPNYQ